MFTPLGVWVLSFAILSKGGDTFGLCKRDTSDPRSSISTTIRWTTPLTKSPVLAAGITGPNDEETFPFSPEELVSMAKDYTSNPSPDWWSDDFVFRGPVIGPLCRKDLIDTLTANLDLQTAFPDLETNAFGFVADDPIEPSRVWYFVRPRGTFAGPFNHPTRGVLEPTNAPYIGPPEVRSVVFDSTGKIRYQTVGYVADRFTGDTTGGRGAVFGQYAVMGETIDPNPGSWTTLFLQKLSEYLPSVPKSYSKLEDLPEWWKDKRKGAEL